MVLEGVSRLDADGGLTAQNSDSAGFQETLTMGLLSDFRQII